MTLSEKVKNIFIKNLPLAAAIPGAVVGWYALPEAYSQLTLGLPIYVGFPKMVFYGLAPVLTSFATSIPLMMISSRFYDDPQVGRTRKEDFRIIRSILREAETLEAKLNVELPQVNFVSRIDSIENEPSDLEAEGIEQQDPGMLALAFEGYILRNRLDDALIALRKALTIKPGQEITLSSLIDLPGLKFLKSISDLFLPRRVSPYLRLVGFNAFRNAELAWRYSWTAREISLRLDMPLKKELSLFHALLSTAYQSNTVDEDWDCALKQLRQIPEAERLGESRAVVRRFTSSDFFAQTLVLKESEDLAALKREEQALKRVRELVPGVHVPEPLYLSPNAVEGKYSLLLRYVEGETLHDRLLKGDEDAVGGVVSALARIHAWYPVEDLTRLVIRDKLKSKLSVAKELAIVDDELATKINRHYSPVANSIEENAFYVWNKDGHPENWIIGEETGCLDCEGDSSIPATLDLANLLDYGDFFTRTERKKYVRQYVAELRSELEERSLATDVYQDEDQLMCSYYNSVIQRMVDLTVAWSDPGRPSMHSKRKRAVERAVEAINDIREEHSDYYIANESDYSHLSQAFEELKQNIAP